MQDIAKIQSYLQSNETFPVPFDEFWEWVGYSRKDVAKRTLQNNFTEGVDFNLHNIAEVQIEGVRRVKREKENIVLTNDCAKAFAMLAQTEVGKQVRQYFLECEKNLNAVRQLVTTTRVQQAIEVDRQESELMEEMQALMEKHEFLEDRLLSLELSVEQDQYTTLKGYYKAQKRDFALTPSEVQKLHAQLKKQSKLLGFGFFFVKDANYQIAYAYHISVLKTVLNF